MAFKKMQHIFHLYQIINLWNIFFIYTKLLTFGDRFNGKNKI